MSLSSKDKLKLDIAMGGKKAADALVAKLAVDQSLSPRELRELEIAICDKKAAAEINLKELQSSSTQQAAIDAAQATVNTDQTAVNNAQATADAADAALVLAPTDGPTIAAAAAAHTALNAAKATLAAAQVVLVAAQQALRANIVSSRSKKAMDIAMASKSGGTALEGLIEE